MLTIYSAVLNDGLSADHENYRSKESILSEVGDLSWGAFKPLLADAIVGCLGPIQAKYEKVRAEEGYLDGVLRDGRDRARKQASNTVRDVKVAMGFSLPK